MSPQRRSFLLLEAALDEPPLFAAYPDEEWSPTPAGLPLGEQSVPVLRDTAA